MSRWKTVFFDAPIAEPGKPCDSIFHWIFLSGRPRHSRAEKRFHAWLHANAPKDAVNRLLDRGESTDRRVLSSSKPSSERRRPLGAALKPSAPASLARDFLTRLRSVRSPLRALGISEVGALT